mmetsp:Transcript_23535/g.42454  ORF Transcript_23535/g.42454 Transcript_23535/m.42454 type:complete len:581 (-) Transcript_23535:130-1872(-)|eukprot:CAMPEP_0197660486 /NCGR_PEP_ID=MMETSP1338-20131121/50872_1 /TAXON_ID=43686 ORGANISM="Pelagodinium beii, Strain RCC1491" /NCGR_SAMPLE_ID=MMETSP1338 /ASSEMBLY_ACC=CAM_ASM_000754 /LENGTH=580 /DNA_ID=CAMNT_0043237841 /DNA_START=41 /DNA_END=1783 /DNA_ORIENTATION=+
MAAEKEAQDMGGAVQAHDAGPVMPAQDGYDPKKHKMASDFVGGDWKTFYDFLPEKDEPFLFSIDGRKPLSFAALKAFLLSEKNDIPGMAREDRLCLVFPTGPELAVAYLAFALRCTVAPLNLFLRADEFDFEYEDLPCKGLVVQKTDMLAEDEKAATTIAVAQARKKKIQIILQLTPSPDAAGLFTIDKHAAGKPLTGDKLGPPLETVKREHVCLVLHTSGTTKKPKIVPITHESMAIGGMCHAAANLLGADDVFVNTMPMFHIAGLMENLLMSAFSGSRFVALPGVYKAHTFFEAMMKEPKATCYSAVPAHHMSLMGLAKEAKSFESSLRVIRNDSAALLPSLAEQMEEFFKATVLPAYSMTEANPLCSNPRFGVRKLKSVGPTVGPELAVMAAWPSDKRMGPGEEGEVCVRGPTVMCGYEMRPHMDKDPNAEAFTDGFMRSGDKGWVDEEGYLYLIGRFKELINRAGEKVSPFEVEDAVRKHADVQDVLCFSCPHTVFGEAVGVVVVPKEGKTVKLFGLRQWLTKEKVLQDKWCPEVLAIMKELPKGSTGKPARINLATKLGLSELDGNLKEFEHPGL